MTGAVHGPPPVRRLDRPPPGPPTSPFCTAVAVLTCGPSNRAHGVTVSTVALASAEPPMISVALRRDGRGLAELTSQPVFAVNGLAADQAPVARAFARPGRGAEAAVGGRPPWGPCTPAGVPALADTLGWLECRLDRLIPVGDHVLLIARVLNADQRPGSPLLTFAGALDAGAMPSREDLRS